MKRIDEQNPVPLLDEGHEGLKSFARSTANAGNERAAWDRLETKLLGDQLGRRSKWMFAAVASVAVALSAVVVFPRGNQTVEEHPMVLSAGKHQLAGIGELEIPSGSRARIEGRVVMVEEGGLSIRVLPEVDTVRVAVGSYAFVSVGSAFQVKRGAEGVALSVSEGSVAVHEGARSLGAYGAGSHWSSGHEQRPGDGEASARSPTLAARGGDEKTSPAVGARSTGVAAAPSLAVTHAPSLGGAAVPSPGVAGAPSLSGVAVPSPAVEASSSPVPGRDEETPPIPEARGRAVRRQPAKTSTRGSEPTPPSISVRARVVDQPAPLGTAALGGSLPAKACATSLEMRDVAGAIACYRSQESAGGLEGQTATYEIARIQRDVLGDFPAALATFTRYREQFPHGVFELEASLSVIELLPRLGRYRAALEESAELLDARRDFERAAELRLLRGNLYREALNDCSGARAEYAHAANDRGPVGDSAAFFLALCLEQEGDTAQAVEKYVEYLNRPRARRADEARRRMEKLQPRR
jgi:hypothetical protein